MPGTPKPGIDPRFGQPWTTVFQALQLGQQKAAAQVAGQNQGNILDQYGNTTEVSGTNLSQVVVIGAAWKVAGVEVGTGIANGVSGRVTQSGLVTAHVNLVAGTNSVTVLGTPPAFEAGMVIGAADITDPSSGIATPAIVPGSVIESVSGSTLTLTPPSLVPHAVVETHSSVYCAAAFFTLNT